MLVYDRQQAQCRSNNIMLEEVYSLDSKENSPVIVLYYRQFKIRDSEVVPYIYLANAYTEREFMEQENIISLRNH